MDAKPASESRSQLARWMGVLDANAAGNVHGGTVMKLCDEAAALAAIKHSRRRVVTAAMDRMAFLYPIHDGERSLADLDGSRSTRRRGEPTDRRGASHELGLPDDGRPR